jgi:hypothetical protein
MRYAHAGHARTWTMQTTAGAARRLSATWSYQGYHAFFGALHRDHCGWTEVHAFSRHLRDRKRQHRHPMTVDAAGNLTLAPINIV